jgi:hypothetical protein
MSKAEVGLLTQGLRDYRDAMQALLRFRRLIWDASAASFVSNQARINNLIGTKLERKDMQEGSDEDFIDLYGGHDYTRALYGFDLGVYWTDVPDKKGTIAYAYCSIYMNKVPYLRLLQNLGDTVEEDADAGSQSGYYLTISEELNQKGKIDLPRVFDQIIKSWLRLAPKIKKTVKGKRF